MVITHLRFQQDEKHTKGLFFIDGVFQCFILEDKYNKDKVYGETRIWPGTRKIELRTEGGMHEKYKERFGDWHKGMLWITEVNNFEYVYIHIGNTPEDTLGCLLTGFSADIDKASVGQSTAAYQHIYPQIADAILAGEDVFIETIDFEQLP